MSNKELLAIEPSELKFNLELGKLVSCSLQLSNSTDDHVAFKVKTTNPKKYCVRPNTGVVLPGSTCDVTVTMQAQKEAPTDLQCKDKFLVQSVVVSAGATVKDVSAEMFSKDSGKVVEESKLKVVYMLQPQPSSPSVAAGSEEGSSPSPSISGSNGALAASDMLRNVSSAYIDSQRKPFEASTLITKLTGEKNSAIQQNNRLRQELEDLRLKVSNQNSGFSLMVVVIIAITGVILGYLVKT